MTREEARRLAVRSQLLHRQPDVVDADTLLAVFRRLGCVQIDPMNVVARSPLLVLWSRLGNFDERLLDQLLWQDRLLFEYWAHAASIVLTEDFPIHQMQMINFRRDMGRWSEHVRAWLAANEPFRQYILEELARRGPLYAADFHRADDRYVVKPWSSSGWSNDRSASTMLGLMWEQGDITVTRRLGNGFGLKKQWGLLEHHMPQWSDHQPMPQDQVVKMAAQRSLQALGVATEKHIRNHFIRNRYPNLAIVIEALLAEGLIRPVEIVDMVEQKRPQPWYIHKETIPELQRLRAETQANHLVLLSPFDNLIADRDRTETLFDFYYRIEIYTPKAKRIYGYYVLPVLSGSRLIGRIDPKMDRKTKTLHVHAVHAEPEAPPVGAELHDTIRRLGQFLGADRVQYGAQLPTVWAAELRDSTC